MLDKNDLQQIGQLLDEKLDPIRQSFNSIDREIEDIKIILNRIDKRTDEDTRMVFKDVEVLKERIEKLELEVKRLKTV